VYQLQTVRHGAVAGAVYRESSWSEFHVGVFQAVDMRVKRDPLDTFPSSRKISLILVYTVQVGLEALFDSVPSVVPPASQPASRAVFIANVIVVLIFGGELHVVMDRQAVP